MSRCPFCRDACAAEGDVVACRECLSRHHAACWRESGGCASCRCQAALGPVSP